MMDGKFKMTEVGLVPEDWEVRRLGDLFDFKNGLNKGKEFFGYGTPIVNFTDVFNNPKMYKDSIKGLVSVNNNDIKSCNVHKGDVFFTRTSETPEEVGMSSVLLDEIDSAVFSGFVLRARPKTKLLDSEYSGTALRSKCIRNQIIKSASYTTRALTSGAKLSSVLIPLPPLPEQQKISKALSDVDGLISSLDALIAKKRDIKKGAMQQLLTGKKRLPGFEEAWVEKRLGDALQYEQPTAYIVQDTEYIEHGIPVLTAGKSFILGYTAEKEGVYDKGDVIIFDDFTTDSKYVSFPFKAKSSAMKMLTAKDGYNLRFVYELLSTIDYKPSDHMRHWIGMFSNLTILMPTLPEQSAIASILTSMDNEIATLEAKRDKYISIKQGMMQELLTGKTRLI